MRLEGCLTGQDLRVLNSGPCKFEAKKKKEKKKTALYYYRSSVTGIRAIYFTLNLT